MRPRPPPSELRPDGAGRFRTDEGPGTFVAHTARDGTVTFEDRSSASLGPFLPLPIISGRLDVTDLVMRAAGQDPYAARKLAFLDRTRDQRFALGAAARTENLATAVAITPAHLERVWRGPEAAAARRRLLFQLWDECAEAGPDEVVVAAAIVRASVVAFVRRRLPPGHPDGFTAAELAALNARRASRARFAPY